MAEKRQVFKPLVEDILSEGLRFVFTAKGNSMSPFISDGDTVLIKPCGSSVHTGDVLLFRQSDSALVLHRLIKKSGRGVITRGDACVIDDGLTRFEDIIGRAVRIEGRITSMFLFFPLGYLLVCGLQLRTYPRLFHPVKRRIRRLFFRRMMGRSEDVTRYAADVPEGKRSRQ